MKSAKDRSDDSGPLNWPPDRRNFSREISDILQVTVFPFMQAKSVNA
jgi:hypothetical protein